MKRMFPLPLALALLCGCTAAPAKTEETASKRYEATFLTLFDTVTTIVGYAQTETDFTATAQAIHDDLLEYHQLYDIYNEYEGINNLKTINDHAGDAPVPVDRKIIDLLLFSKDLYARTGGKVNIAMGSISAPPAPRSSRWATRSRWARRSVTPMVFAPRSMPLCPARWWRWNPAPIPVAGRCCPL